jgi:endonuclease/exonuclease/phosphatase family metal-dependent hydrolase
VTGFLHWFFNITRSEVLRLGLVTTLSAGIISCDRSGTPDWDRPGGGVAEGEVTSAEPPVSQPAETKPVQAALPAASPPALAEVRSQQSQDGLRFICYNVRNWLTMDRYVDRRSLKNSPKPDDEKKAVITILARHNPDVVGLCEIGTADDLAEIQQLLKSEGIDLPHSHYAGGSDQTRRLGFLSRFPIVETGKPEKTEFQIQGKMFTWNRGVLDATIDAHGRHYRFLGVHLKSKRDVEEGDQEEIRRSEARLLRRHVDQILEKNPDERLIVYGDFNDTRASVAAKHAVGSYNDPKYLTAIPAVDSAGTRWTHFWALNDIYSRIDFVAVSRGLKPDTRFDDAKILDDPEWEKASDHRALLTVFR